MNVQSYPKSFLKNRVGDFFQSVAKRQAVVKVQTDRSVNIYSFFQQIKSAVSYYITDIQKG